MNINSILTAFKKQVQALYGDNLVQIILYGSYARGDFNSASDIDLLVLINQKDQIKEDQLSDISYSFLINDEVLVNAFPAEKNEFDTFWNPLYFNIKKEGILV